MEGSENGFAPLQTWFPQSCLLLLGDQGKFQSCSLSFFMQTGRELGKLEREDIVSEPGKSCKATPEQRDRVAPWRKKGG